MGPILSIVLFQTLGDEWKLSDLRLIVVVGLCLEMFNSILMMFFDDSKALDETEGDGEGAESTQEQPQCQPGPRTDSSDEDGVTPAAEASSSDTERLLPETEPSNQAIENTATQRLKRRQRWIPIIMSISGFVMAIGSGMTVKFFPLFFKDEVGMSPTQVQCVYVAVPIFMVLCSGIGIRLAKSFGRVQTCLVLSSLGLACLFSMVFFKNYLDAHPLILVPIYITRTGLMNSPYPLIESILMDFVPKNERARWKSLESITAFGWCGSASLGGYISDRYDYTYTFFITAVVQSASTLMFALLLPLVPRKEDEQASSES